MTMLRLTSVGIIGLCLSGLAVSASTAGGIGYESVGHVRGTSFGTIDLRYTGIAGDAAAGKVVVNGVSRQSGHIIHDILSGPQSGTSFRTFCIELRQTIGSGGVVTYDIVDLSDAPLPGPQYGAAIGNAINAVVANAIALGWIDNRLQADTSQTNYLGRMGAIQAAIWEATGDTLDLNASGTSASVRSAYLELMGATFDPTLRLNGLRGLINASRQDMLYVVPLPPAVFAGAGLLAIGLGVRAWRRR